MNKTRILCLTILCFAFLASLAKAEVSISIKEIKQNQFISGKVKGLTKEGKNKMKVVVFVLTDVWYIHPFTQGEEGKSWASIKSNGEWRIGTIRREFAASAIAALVVERDAVIPPKAPSLEGIPNKAIAVKNLRGTPNFGAL